MTRGDIWWVDLGLPLGSEPGFERPVLIVQSDAFNESRIGTTIVVPFTTNLGLAEAPGNVLVPAKETRLPKESVVAVSQVTTIDRARLLRYHSSLAGTRMREVEAGIALVLELKAWQ